jgi:hypothetical protein
MGLPHTGVCTFEKPSREPSESLDWARRTSLLAPAFAGYHSAGYLSLEVCQGPGVCYPCAWPSNVTRPHSWCDCLSNPGHVGYGKKLRTDLTLFVSPVGHMLKCTKLTTATQILWVPLSYTTNCIHLAFTFFSQWWIELWDVWTGQPVYILFRAPIYFVRWAVFIYGLTTLSAQRIKRWMIGWLMNSGLERIWNKAVVSWQEIEKRLDIIRATSGSHVEAYWTNNCCKHSWVPLSCTTNCINLAFTVFSQWWIQMWEV